MRVCLNKVNDLTCFCMQCSPHASHHLISERIANQYANDSQGMRKFIIRTLNERNWNRMKQLKLF